MRKYFSQDKAKDAARLAPILGNPNTSRVLGKEGAVIIITHQMSVIEEVCSNVAILDHGAIGGGDLGKLAINYGYYRYKYLVMIITVILLILLVQIFQSIGTKLSVVSDKRLKKK